MDLYQTAISQFQRAADIIQLSADYQPILAELENEIVVNFPVRLDSGELCIFKGLSDTT